MKKKQEEKSRKMLFHKLLTKTANIGVACSDEVDDYKSTGSVLEKLSLFEKLEQRQASAVGTLTKQNSTGSTGSNNESPSGIRRNDEISKPIRSIEKDPGMSFDFTLLFPSSFCFFFFF